MSKEKFDGFVKSQKCALSLDARGLRGGKIRLFTNSSNFIYDKFDI